MRRSRTSIPLFTESSLLLSAGLLALGGALSGCDPLPSGDDPWGCNDRSPLQAADRRLPDPRPGVPYRQDIGSGMASNVTLIDTALAARAGLRQEGSSLVGDIADRTQGGELSLRWLAWENGTQCMGRTDTFLTVLYLPALP